MSRSEPITEVEARARIWKTLEGRQLAALARRAYGQQPVALALATVKKDANAHRYTDALWILAEGWPH